MICEQISRQLEYQPASANEKGVLGPSVVAWLAKPKFERHLPIYRLQEELQSASRMWFSRSVLCGAVVRTAARLRPLVGLILRQVLKSFYVRADATAEVRKQVRMRASAPILQRLHK